jgi:hypothetical protein
MRFVTWRNIIYNAYEPNNVLWFAGELTSADTYAAFRLWGRLTFSDGAFIISIKRSENNRFCWKNDNKTGFSSSFDEAWRKMPALITDPDDYMETSMIYYDQYNE